MERCINTKFNIGDVVYIAHSYEMYSPNKEPYVVCGIDIKINANKTWIIYDVKQDGITNRFTEEWLCETYEECTRWCEKRN